MIKKIITHNGVFHADEVFAIALLKHVFGDAIEVVRTRDITIDNMNDPDVWVIDVGLVYAMDMHNFDHHQDKNLESSNVLVLEYLKDENLISQELYDRLITSFKAISYIDRHGYSENDKSFHVNSLIKSINSLSSHAFQTALVIAQNYIYATKKFVDNQILWKESYDNGIDVNEIAVFSKDVFPVTWKEYARLPFLIERADDKLKLHSCNSKEYPIIATGKEEFIHVNKFIAVYNTIDDAWAAIRIQKEKYKDKSFIFNKDEK